MSAPVWMAAPPEVHSTLLSSGPGPGAVLAAAETWSALSAEYASVGEELDAVLAAVQAGSWAGPSVEQYVAAHLPYLAWLTQASTASASAAAQHEAAAGAYTAALAAMPTLVELAANHTTHGVLVATNFFGVNTIPIALNEADYVRMWIQAATTMATYQAVSDTAVAATPPIAAAPRIQKPTGGNAAVHDPTVADPTTDLIADVLHTFGYQWNPAQGTLNGLGYDAYTNPGQPIYWLVRSLELFEDFQQFGTTLLTNPVGAFQYLVSLELFDWPTHLAEIATWLAQTPQLLAGALGAAIAPAGLSGLAGLAGLPQPASAPALPVPTPLDGWPVAATPPAAPAVAATAATTPAAVPGPPAAPPAATAAASSPAAGIGGFGYPYLVGPPGTGFGPGIAVGASASCRVGRKAPEPDSAAATAAARDRRRTRRCRHAAQRDHGDEFADMNVAIAPDWAVPPDEPAASDQGAGMLGFAGATHRAAAGRAAGLTTLAGGAFAGGPTVPMTPATWNHESDCHPDRR